MRRKRYYDTVGSFCTHGNIFEENMFVTICLLGENKKVLVNNLPIVLLWVLPVGPGLKAPIARAETFVIGSNLCIESNICDGMPSQEATGPNIQSISRYQNILKFVEHSQRFEISTYV